nr:aminotransferase class V-fold PLP-dependent enzyme [Aliidiomarina indica]
MLSAHSSHYPHEIFMDANATTPVLPALQELMSKVYQTHYGNPSSPHYAGIRAKRVLNDTRNAGAHLFACEPDQIIFMSGATEGINTAVLSVLQSYAGGKGKGCYLLYSATEHKAVPEALRHWNTLLQVEAEVMAIPVDREGQIDLEFLRAHVGDALMICTMGANNETGVYCDLAALEREIRALRSDIPWLVDCVQMLGKRPIALGKTTIDYAPFSAHKLYGPKGVGALYVRTGAPFTPLQTGGGQERGLRGGTENVAGIAALGQIFTWLNDRAISPFQDSETLYGYRQTIIDALQSAFPKLTLNQPLDRSLATTINFSVAGYSSSELIAIFDAAGIRVSAGSACSTGGARSFVLDAMGLPTWQSEGAIRMSFGPAFSQADLDTLCERLTFIRDKITGANPWGQGALYIPDPMTSGSAWIMCRTTQQALALTDSPDVMQGIESCCPETDWQIQVWNKESQDFAGFRLHREANGVRITALATERSIQLTDAGIVVAHTPSPKLMAVSEFNCEQMTFIDVREQSEALAQYHEYPSPCLQTIPRALWCDYVLRAEPEGSPRPIFFCRSGNRATEVARLALSVGWQDACACNAAASEVFDWLRRQKTPVE